MPRGVQISVETWLAAREAIENGEPYPLVAERYRLKLSTLRRRAAQERWESPSRKKSGTARTDRDTRGSEISERAPSLVTEPVSETESQLAIRANELALSPHRESLLDAAKEGPEAFRKALERTAQTALAESVADIPLPRTIGEWKTMVDILEKTRKMGAPEADNRFVRALPSLSRGRVVDADPIPEVEGFKI